MSRGRRWTIGLVTAGVLLAVAAVLGAVAAGSAFGTMVAEQADCALPDDSPSGCADDRLTGRAAGTLVDARTTKWGQEVDVEYNLPSGTTSATLDWPPFAGSVPTKGDTVWVAYDPSDPENTAVPLAVLVNAKPSEGSAGPDPQAVGAGWSALVCLLLALVTVLLTWGWARRAPAAPAPGPQPAAGPWGYAAPVGYPVPMPYPGLPAAYPAPTPYPGPPAAYPGQSAAPGYGTLPGGYGPGGYAGYPPPGVHSGYPPPGSAPVPAAPLEAGASGPGAAAGASGPAPAGLLASGEPPAADDPRWTTPA
ncbi:MAG TPA: hypothetical protein VFP72_07000 [Kineosporiaceae bacterium]|nr:hypothetical protein [Kineosporiaceae bacterium]